MLPATLKKNDSLARLLILTVSFVVFTVVVVLSQVKLNVDLGFNIHLFAKANAFINAAVAVLLLAALLAVKTKKFELHKRLMLVAIFLSLLFLISYIAHHLLSGDTKFGDANLDGIVSQTEKLAVGSMRLVYFIILITHIFLAAVILPFILFTSYRALIAEFAAHKKLARITWPIWFYVAVTGPIVYYFISPYYA